MRRALSSAWVRSVMAMVVMCAALVALAPAAHAADPPPERTISGTVTDASNGMRIPGIDVTLYYFSGGWQYYMSTTTGYDGTYQFGGLPDDTFRVGFDSTGQYNGLYVAEYYNDQSTIDAAQNIGILGGAGVAGIDAALTRLTGTGSGGSIAGTVTGAGTGWPLENIYVQLYYEAGGWSLAANTYTAADGSYYFTGLAPEDYTLYFYDYSGTYVGTYYPGTGDIGSATPVTVGADAHVPGIDQELNPPPSWITGTVTDESTGDPLGSVWVYLYRDDGSGPYYMGTDFTGDDGRYVFAYLAAADYYLFVEDGTGYYLSEWWQDTDETGATVIALDGTDGAVADPQLALGGQISGTITAEGSGDPLNNAYVALYRYDDESDAWVWATGAGTDVTGAYSVYGLPYGTYRAQFTDWSGVYLSEYYVNAAGLLAATDIVVTAAPHTSINGVLTRGGRVSGFVVDDDSYDPVSGAEVLPLQYRDDGSWYTAWEHRAFSDGTGAFTVTGLPFGTYRFQVSATSYVTEYWQDASDVELGTSWAVIDDTLQSGLNFEIARTGSISGTVYDLGSSPLTNVYVQAYRQAVDSNGDPYWSGVRGSSTSGAGTYTIDQLPPGTYRVWFYDQNVTPPDYKTEYYAEKPNVWTADDVTVSPGGTVTGINAHLSPGASISGTVRDESNNPLQSVAVSAFAYDPGEDDWERFGATVYTDASGDYTITGLADDTYRLGFSKGGYLPEYYSDVSNVFEADDVAIVAGTSVTGRDAVLAAGSAPPNGTIMGTIISDDSGLPISGARAVAWRCDPITYADGWYWANSNTTGPSGGFSMSVPPGVYHVQFVDAQSSPVRFIDEYYSDQPAGRYADEVYVTSGSTVVANAGLATGGTITGRITDAVTAGPVPNVNVYVYGTSDDALYWAGWGQSGADGTYTVGGLPTGSFIVYAQPSDNDHRSEYYEDALSWGTADRVVVDVGTTIPDIDIALTPLATVRGHVTDAHDGRVVDAIDVTLWRKGLDSYAWWTDSTTDAGGLYEMSGIPAGEYVVSFADSGAYGLERYVSEYHSDATKASSATPVIVGAESVTVNEELTSTGTWGDVSGCIIDDITHEPIADIAVRRWDPDGGSGWLDSGYGTSTSATGDYLMQWVPVGDDYRVAADPDTDLGSGTPWTGIYPRTFYDNDATPEAGVPVEVFAGAQTVDVIINVAPEANVGYLSGHVIEDGTGADVPGAQITLYLDEGYWTQLTPFAADGSGRFIRPVIEGAYAVEIDGLPAHGREYYEDIDSWNPGDGTPVVVTASASTEMTASLEPLSSVAGLVTAETGGAPLPNTYITLYRYTEGAGWNWYDARYTEDDGTYLFEAVSYGSYTCEFADDTGDYVDEFYNNKARLDLADAFAVGAAPVTGIDAALTNAGSISGTVTDNQTGLPLATGYVSAYRYDPSSLSWTSVSGANTDAVGTYRIGGLAAGTYRVNAYDNSGLRAGEFYLDVRDVGDATDVPLAYDEDVTGIDFALEARGSISGTITDVKTASPLSGAWAYAYRYRPNVDEWVYAGGDSTDAGGAYTITGLPPATYHLYITRSGYVSEHLHDEYDVRWADDVVLGEGVDLTGIDEALSPGASISGTVRNGSGTAIPNLRVVALRYDYEHAVWTYGTSDWTDSNGFYEITSLGDYEYRVLFADSYGRYAHEYYNDATDAAAATPVPVIAGTGQSGIDAVLSPYVAPPNGTLSGIVRSDPGAVPLEGITVSAHRFDPATGGWLVPGEATTAADGTYSFAVPAGTYRLCFASENGAYLTEFHHDAADVWDATDHLVTDGETTTVNEGLRSAARIRGTVTADSGGAPLPGISVGVYRIDYESGYTWHGGVETGADGSYEIGDLTAGDYLLQFSDGAQTYLSEWYDDAEGAGTSTWVTLADAEIRENVDAALATAGTIGGRVTDEASGRQAEGVRVLLNRTDGSNAWYYSDVQTDENGEYLFRGLPDGMYCLEFSDPWSPTGFERFESEYYIDAADLAGSTLIVIDNQHVTADAQLTSTGTWGSVTGTVTDSVTGHPVPDMPMRLYVWNGADFELVGSLTATSDSAGAYEFPYVLDPGSGGPFRVLADASASDWLNVYAPTAHLDGTSVDDGDNVVVAGGTYVTGIDVHMSRLADVGWIGGAVTSDASGLPLAGIVVDYYRSTGEWVGAVTTAADGTYGRALTPGSYALKFSDPAGVYATEHYDEKTTVAAADPIVLDPDASIVVDESLAAAARITGQIRDTSGEPVDTWCSLYDATTGDHIVDLWSTGGVYEVGGLQAGTYWVYFSSTGNLSSEFWNDRRNHGDDIIVGTGETVSGIDAVLAEPGTISGTITSDDGLLDSSVHVTYYSEEPLGWDYAWSNWVSEGAGDWAFQSTSLKTGDYVLRFYDDASRYALTYHNTVTDIADATPVTIAEADDTSVELIFDGLPPDVNTDALALYNDSASIEITATDLTAGVESVSYDLDGAGTVETPGDTASLNASGYGDHTLYYWAIDEVGNEASHVQHDFFIDDSIAPSIISNALSSYPVTATITLTATDSAGGSGVSSISYRIDGGTTETVSADSLEVDIGGIGSHTLMYWAEDVAGNESAHESDEFSIADTVAPTVVDDAVASYDDVAVITLTATDNPGGEGVDHISYRLNGGTWVVVSGAECEVTVTDPGDHTLEYSATDLADNTSAIEDAVFEVVRTGGVTEVPIAGDDRYRTAVEISKAAFDSAEWVVIATGANWPDALGGSALAGALEGPILLTATDTLPDVVRNEVLRLGADKAIILGGTSAVGTSVETALKTLLGAADVTRLGGSNRYRTADMIAERTIDELGSGYDGTAFVATGANYPDALAAAPLSAGLHWPLFLTPTTGLDANTKAAMAGVEEVLILGGTAVVPQAIEDSLEVTYGDEDVTRLAGADRYDTAVKVATHGVANGLGWNRLAITTGEQFPDALAGGVLQGRDGSVMLLTRSASLPDTVRTALQANRALIAEVRYLGGTSAVTQAVRDTVAAILNQ